MSSATDLLGTGQPSSEESVPNVLLAVENQKVDEVQSISNMPQGGNAVLKGSNLLGESSQPVEVIPNSNSNAGSDQPPSFWHLDANQFVAFILLKRSSL